MASGHDQNLPDFGTCESSCSCSAIGHEPPDAQETEASVLTDVPIKQASVFLTAAAEEQWLIAQTTSAEREIAFVLAYGPIAQSGKCAVSAICSLCALSPFPLTPPTLGSC